MTRVALRRIAASALLALSGAIAGEARAAGDSPDLSEAMKHMEAGTLLYKDPPKGHKCEEALEEFKKAYELSGKWRALRAMAICEFWLERDADAILHYEQVLEKGKDELKPEERKEIEDDIKRLKPLIASLHLTTNQPNVKLVATRQPLQGETKSNRYTIPAEGITLGIHPGQYTFTATVDGFEPITWDQEVGNGSKVERQLTFEPKKTAEKKPDTAPVMERPVPVTVWIFTGLTVASAATWGVMMGLAKVANDDFSERNGAPGATQTELEDLRQDVITKNIVADVMLGVTGLSLGATLIFYFTRPEVAVTKETSLVVLPFAPSGMSSATTVGATVIGTF
ncbi:MAG: hypothetical protein U0271_29560 [Polyangiaceae bacterium]